jgi:hypothetical protein
VPLEQTRGASVHSDFALEQSARGVVRAIDSLRELSRGVALGAERLAQGFGARAVKKARRATIQLLHLLQTCLVEL